MAKKPLYIQLEPGAYPKDIDWQMMTAEERGCYHSLIIFLACGNGTLPDKTDSLAILCNVNSKKMKTFLNKFENKFTKKDGNIAHKRVSEEIKRAKKRLQAASASGLRGAKKRWGPHGNPIKDPIKKPISKDKGKGKVREGKQTKPKGHLDFSSIDFKQLFFEEFKPINQYEQNTLIKVAGKCDKSGLPNISRYIIDVIMDLKEYGKINKKNRTDLIKMFVSKVTKESWCK